jgi:hypothetical protein
MKIEEFIASDDAKVVALAIQESIRESTQEIVTAIDQLGEVIRCQNQ